MNAHACRVRTVQAGLLALIMAAVPARGEWSRIFHEPGLDRRAVTGAWFRGDYVIGGFFISAGDLVVNHVVRWDGGAWRSLGSGTNGGVSLVYPYRDKLLVGGSFTRAGDHEAAHVALWNGTEWEPMGEGIPSPVGAAAVEFATALTVATWSEVYRWDGSYWTQLGRGGFDRRIRALAVFHGALYAGGEFLYHRSFEGEPHSVRIRGLAKWAGDRWVPVPGFQAGIVRALVPYEGKLAVAGHFTLDTPDTTRNEALLAFWDGATWSFLDGPNLGHTRPDQKVIGLAPTGPRGFWVSGDFSIGNPPMPDDPTLSLAKWDGRAWSVPHTLPQGYLHALGPTPSGLMVAGDFELTGDGEGPIPIRHAASWDGTTWSRLGSEFGLALPGRAEDLEVFQSQLVVTGDFPDRIRISGPDGWETPGGGLPSAVRDMTVYEDKLVAAGYLRFQPGVDNIRVAAWDGVEDWEVLGPGFSGSVHAATVFGGDLVVGGYTERIGTLPVNRVARWDGSEWHDMSAGMGAYNSSDPVLSFVTIENTLYAGGRFNLEHEGQKVARWDGSAWVSVGEVKADWVTRVLEYQGTLYACGQFDPAGTEETFYALARWNGGESWSYAGAIEYPIVPGPIAHAMEIYDDKLVVGGFFSKVNDIPVGNLFAFDGTTFSDGGFGGGANDRVHDLLAHEGALYAAGRFRTMDGILSVHIAKWTGPVDVVPVELAYFTAEAAPEGVLLRWGSASAPEDHAGFRVHRALRGGNRVRVSELLSGRREYRFLDTAAPPGDLAYWLADHARDGSVTWHGPVPVTRTLGTLLANVPNPFRDATTFRFDVARAGMVRLKVFDTAGRVVAEPVSQVLPRGRHEIRWTGTDRRGTRLPPTVYYYRLETKDGVSARKLVIRP